MTEGDISLDSSFPARDAAQTGGCASPSASACPPVAAAYGQPSTVEWDHKGRVVRSRFGNGQVLQFRYDQQGALYAFTYAGLAWSTTNSVRFTAVDEDNTYIIDGSVEVGMDGCLCIKKDGVRRTIKLNGAICDQLADGTRIESPRTSPQLMAHDLLAVIKPKNSDTLNRLTPFRTPAPTAQPGFLAEPDSTAEPVFVAKPGSLAKPAATAAAAAVGSLPGAAEPARRSLAQGARIRYPKAATGKGTAAKTKAADIVGWLKETIAAGQIKWSERLHGADSISVAPQLDALAAAAYGARKVDEARLLHERALTIRRQALGESHPDVGISLHGLATIYHDWGRYNEAEQYYLEGIKLLDQGFRKAVFLHSVGAVEAAYLGEHLERLMLCLHSLASLYHEHKHPHLCEQIYHAAVHLCGKVGQPFRAQVAAKLESLAAMCAHLDMERRPAEAQLRISRWERRARF